MRSNKSILINYIYNLSYQVLAILTPLITTPYISRVLGANNIGIYSYALSISTYFIIIGNLGFPLYGQREIAYSNNNKYKYSKKFFDVFASKILFLLIALCLYLLYIQLFIDEYKELYYILTLGIFADIINIGWLFQGLEEFKTIAIRNILIKTTTIILLFVLVKSPFDLNLYASIICVSNFFGNMVLFYNIRKYLDFSAFKTITLNGIIHQLLPAVVLGIPYYITSVYSVVDKTMLGGITGDFSQVGYYEQSQKIIVFSLSLVTSLGTVFLPRLASVVSQGDYKEIYRLTNRGIQATIVISIPIAFGILSISDILVPWFFGPGYDNVVDLLNMFSMMVLFMGLSTYLGNQYMIAAKKEKQLCITIAVGVIVNIIFNILLIPQGKALGSAISTVISEVVKVILQIYVCKKVIDFNKATNAISKSMIAGIFMYSIISIIKIRWEITPDMLSTINLSIVGAIVYCGVMFVFYKEQASSLIQILINRFRRI